MIRLNEIGYVFQECYLCENLNVFENIMLPLMINKKLSEKEKIKIVNDLLSLINLIKKISKLFLSLGLTCIIISV